MSRYADAGIHLFLGALAAVIGWGLLIDPGTSAYVAMRVLAGYALWCAAISVVRAVAGERIDRWYDEGVNLGLAALALVLAVVALSWDGSAALAAVPLAVVGLALLARTALRLRR
ncbi:hypothetical protein [Nocardioides montaniterrae]